MQPFIDTRNPYEVTRKIFAGCDSIYQEEIAKAKRRRLRNQFKKFIKSENAKQKHKLKLIDKFYK